MHFKMIPLNALRKSRVDPEDRVISLTKRLALGRGKSENTARLNLDMAKNVLSLGPDAMDKDFSTLAVAHLINPRAGGDVMARQEEKG